ncbi:MAG TPA: hypothetical protein VHU84_17990 [Lacipirellulaceae bacterium]|jgi:hypothetical protein|nr:hypothetical protein [Lacipirellulaceae bacterium]
MRILPLAFALSLKYLNREYQPVPVMSRERPIAAAARPHSMSALPGTHAGKLGGMTVLSEPQAQVVWRTTSGPIQWERGAQLGGDPG